MPTIKPATHADAANIERAYALLGQTRDLLKTAGAPRTLERVRLALTSCQGAIRHASTRVHRTPQSHPAPKVTAPAAPSVWVLSWDVRNANEQTGSRLFVSEKLAIDQVIEWLCDDFGMYPNEAAVRRVLKRDGCITIEDDKFYSIASDTPRTAIDGF